MKKKYTFILSFFLFCYIIKAQTTDFTELEGAYELLLNGNDLYIAETSLTSPFNKILKVDITTTNPTPIELVDGLKAPRGLALKGNYLYISEDRGNKISKVDITAANPTLIEVVTGLNSPRGLAFKGNDLYFAEFATNKISKIDITASTPTITDVVTGLKEAPAGIAFKGNDLYITELTGSKILKIDITSTTPTLKEVVTGLKSPTEIIFKGNNLYIAEYFGSKVSKIDITSTTSPIDILTGISFPAGLAFNGNDLFITSIVLFNPDKIIKNNLSNTLSTNKVNPKPDFKIYPNPGNDFIIVSGIDTSKNYKIHDLTGSLIKTGKISSQEKIDIQNFNNGLYFIQFDNKNTISFIKK